MQGRAGGPGLLTLARSVSKFAIYFEIAGGGRRGRCISGSGAWTIQPVSVCVVGAGFETSNPLNASGTTVTCSSSSVFSPKFKSSRGHTAVRVDEVDGQRPGIGRFSLGIRGKAPARYVQPRARAPRHGTAKISDRAGRDRSLIAFALEKYLQRQQRIRYPQPGPGAGLGSQRLSWRTSSAAVGIGSISS